MELRERVVLEENASVLRRDVVASSMEARWAVGKTKESWEESWKGNETEAAAKGGAGGAAKQAVPESPSKTETKASSAEQAGAAGSAGAGAGAAGRRKEDGGKGSETARCSCDKEAAVHCRDCDVMFCKPCCSRQHSPPGKLSAHRVEALATRDASSSSSSASFRVRLCPQHDWEKLTLYSTRAKRFGCVKCFQGGTLRGYQGQSLQRAVVEVREKLKRDEAGLLSMLSAGKEAREAMQRSAEKVGEGRRTLEDNVRAELGRVKGALDEKGTTLREQLEGWREGQAAEVGERLEPLRRGVAEVEAEMAELRALLELTDDELIEKRDRKSVV